MWINIYNTGKGSFKKFLNNAVLLTLTANTKVQKPLKIKITMQYFEISKDQLQSLFQAQVWNYPSSECC